jgi:hypothetical protein
MVILPPQTSIAVPGFPINVTGFVINKFSNDIISSGSSIISPFLA